MDCPVCDNSAMVVLELDEVEVDFCFDCNGIWLDAGKLELLFDDGQKVVELLGSFKKISDSGESVRKCPICLKKMHKVQVGRVENPLLIDKCRKGHGLWFDKGELQGILSAGSLDKDQKIQKLLADIFGQQEKTKE